MSSIIPDNPPVMLYINEPGIDDQWFSSLVAQVKADQQLIAGAAVSPEIKRRYSDLLTGNLDDLAFQVIEPATRNLVRKIVSEYWSEVKTLKPKLAKLGLSYADSKIFVWAETKEDDDEETEDILLRIEAKITFKYFPKGFNLISTIVEKSDKLSLPNHYQNLLD